MEDNFDGFEVVFGPNESRTAHAWLFEFPEIFSIGYSEEVAIACLKKRWKEWKMATEERRIPLSQQEFSGAFTLRIDPELHKKLSIEALECKLSLNALIERKLERNVAETYKFDDITPYAVERGGRTKELTSIFFHLNDIEDEEKVILQFDEDSLREAMEEWGDLNSGYMVSQDQELLELFSSAAIKESVKKFLSSQLKRGGLNGIEKIECVAVTQDIEEQKVFSIHRFIWK